MLNSRTEELARARGIFAPKIFSDIDGPGIGNSAITEREERPKEGGILVYLFEYKYPYKGSPDNSSVQNLHAVKKLLLYSLRTFNILLIKILIGIAIFLPRVLTKRIFEAIIDYFQTYISWRLYYDFLRPERYCPCVRELYGALTKIAEAEKESYLKKALILIRDIFCMAIEYDSAYRFRFQDILAEARISELRGNKKQMLAEIKRLAGILAERETTSPHIREKIGQFVKVIYLILQWVKEARDIFTKIIKEVDFSKLLPDEGDRYFHYLRRDYDFMGKRLEERIEIRKKIDGENWHYFEEVANAFLADYLKYKPKKEAQNK